MGEWWGRWDLNPRPLAPISRSHQRPRFTVQDWTLVSSGRGQNPLDQARRRPLSSESNRAAFLCYARISLVYELRSHLRDEELLRAIIWRKDSLRSGTDHLYDYLLHSIAFLIPSVHLLAVWTDTCCCVDRAIECGLCMR